MLGIEGIKKVVVALFHLGWDVKKSLPKFDIGDLARLWDAVKQGKVMLGNYKQAAQEFRDLDPAEIVVLGQLVKDEFAEEGIVIQNIDLLMQKALTATDAIWDFIELLPNKNAENAATKAAEPGASRG